MRHAPRYSPRPPLRRAAIGARMIVPVALSAGLVACGGDPPLEQPVAATAAPAPDSTPAEFGLVTPQQAHRLAEDGVSVIDVRTPEEFADGHIDGATLIDFYDETFSDDIATLDPAGEYLVYCRSGNRSGQAVAIMQSLGIERIYDLDGGVIAYGAEGLPLVP